MKIILGFFFVCLCFVGSFSQTISGNFSLLSNQPIRLEGFNGFKTYLISNTLTDERGNFRLNYSQSNYGVGYLISTDEKPFIVILNGEDVEVIGEALINVESIRAVKGNENRLFEQYALDHPRREQALSAWVYLEKMYFKDSLFSSQKKPFKAIKREKNRINREDSIFLTNLPAGSYISWFLPMRKLISSLSVVAQYRTDEIPSTREALRKINYADPRLYSSGLFRDALENHIWFLENSSGSLDAVFSDINASLDIILSQFKNDVAKFNEVTDYLFKLLEKRSLYRSSEYLALKVLNEVGCTINQDLASQLEGYRKMKKGNIAPDIVFSEHTYFANGLHAKSLSELPGEYKVVIFAASWCAHCQQEIPKIATLFQEWRKKGVEMVMVSLDDKMEDFVKFSADLPFTSTTDYGKWESKAVKDYHIIGTPTIFLLKNNLEIILKPQSVEQLKAWFDWYLKEGQSQPEDH